MVRLISGDDVGLLKALDLEPSKGLQLSSKFGQVSRSNGIDLLRLVNGRNEMDGVLISAKGSKVKYVRNFQDEVTCSLFTFGDQPCSGLEVGFEEGHVYGCSNDGKLQIVKADFQNETSIFDVFGKELVKELSIGNNITRMRRSTVSGAFAIGGRETDLTLWDVEREAKMFQAKNVPHDFLDMRVPVWVTDMCFLPLSPGALEHGRKTALGGGTPEQVITCTGYGHIRLYDTRARRQPMLDIDFPNVQKKALKNAAQSHHFKAIALLDEFHVAVGSASGEITKVDIRTMKQIGRFKGSNASIRDLSKHPTLPLLASCGLDRYVRVHDTEKCKSVASIYLKQTMTNIQFLEDDQSSQEQEQGEEGVDKNDEQTKTRAKKKREKDIIEDLSSDSDQEDDDDKKHPKKQTTKKKQKKRAKKA